MQIVNEFPASRGLPQRGKNFCLVVRDLCFLFSFSRCHYLLVEVFIYVSIQNVLVMTLVEDGRIMCLVALFADSQMHMEEQRYRSDPPFWK